MVTRVLVTGAAGRIGRAVLALLAERSVEANALVLEDPGDLPARLVVAGDAADATAVRAALAGADGVIHLAAIPTPERTPAQELFAVNTLATFTVLEEAGLAGVRQARSPVPGGSRVCRGRRIRLRTPPTCRSTRRCLRRWRTRTGCPNRSTS